MRVFGNLGVDFAAWALFSFTLAAFLGVLLGRAVAATAVSLAVTTVLDVVTMMALRQHYTTPVTASGAGPTGVGNWVLGNWFTNPGGAQVSARSYQLATHWWQLQLTEGAWLLAASLLLITATILLIRRRPA
jgi:hypothetical protein